MTRDGRPPDNKKAGSGKGTRPPPAPRPPGRARETASQLPGLGEKCAPPSPRPQSWTPPGTCQIKSDLTEPVRRGTAPHGQAAATRQPPRTRPPPRTGDGPGPPARRTPATTTGHARAWPARPRPPRPRTLAGNASPPESQAHPGKTPGQAASTSQRSQARVRNPRQANRTLKPIQALNSYALMSSTVFE